MITSPQEYKDLYYAITDPNNKEYYITIPSDEPVYEINLDTREVQTPEFLSVLEDHNSEIIWFKVNRFHDDFDLYGSTCWIQYRNALKEEYVCVSIPKVIKESDHDMLYIPWPINSPVTKAAGNVEFSFQFYKLSEDKQRMYYSIHTKPAIGKILYGMHIDPLKFIEDGGTDDSEINPQYSEFMRLFQQLAEDYSEVQKGFELYWTEVR